MSVDEPVASHCYEGGRLDEALKFLKRTRSELRMLRKVRVWCDRVQILDINNDAFEIRGLGYRDADIVRVLDSINTAYKRELIHRPKEEDYKEFKTGRRYAWAVDRVM